MITGVGLDMIEVERVAAKVARDNGFKEKVFSPQEIIFCESKPDAAQHFAARFAAKEAFLKAIGFGLQLSLELHEIEVIHTDAGKPTIVLHGTFQKLGVEKGWNNIHLSMTHLKSTACAVVIIER